MLLLIDGVITEKFHIYDEVLRYVVKKVFEKIVDNLDFVENINYIRESSETAVLEFSGINLQENTSAGVLLQ